MNASREKIAWLVLRIGVALPLLYAAFGSLTNPNDWIGYFPGFIQSLAPAKFLLVGHAIFTGILALWLLSGKKIFLPSILAALFATGIIITNWNELEIVFRDITLVAAGIALALHAYSPKRIE
jgi:uncharacterized membrane protein YphA (DoxX/SURF4 family)